MSCKINGILLVFKQVLMNIIGHNTCQEFLAGPGIDEKIIMDHSRHVRFIHGYPIGIDKVPVEI